MVKIPDEVFKAINNPKSQKILASIGEDGPHAIQAGSIIAPSNEMMAVGAILMKKTCKNLKEMKEKDQTVAFLVLDGMKSYEVRCKINDLMTSGPLFDKMSEEVKKMGLTVRGVWTFSPVEVHNQSASYEAGKKMA